VQTTRFVESFELLTRSIALIRPEKFLRKATCDQAVFCEPFELTQVQKC